MTHKARIFKALDDDSNDGSVASTSSTGNASQRTRTLPSPSLLGKRKGSFDSASSMKSPPKQATLDETLQRASSFKPGGQRAKELDDAFLYMCMKDNMPLSTGDKIGMQAFTHQAVPLWKPPSRGRLTTMMEVKYASCSEMVRDALSQLSSVCLTADAWTESHSTSSFLGVTAHFAVGTDMETVVLGVKAIVSYSHRSYNFSNELKRLQAERGNSEGKQLRLLQDCPTRWGSTYLMLDRFLDMDEIVTLAALKFPAESIENITAPVNDDIAKNFRMFIYDEFDRRFDQIESCMPLAISTLVDPRFMTTYFKNPLAVSRARSLIEDMVKKYIREEVTRAETEQPGTTAADQQPTTPNQQKEGGGVLWGDHDAMVAAAYVASSSDDPTGKARTEVRAFLGRPPASRLSNPLEVWESIRQEYPHLYKVARRFIPMLGTSVPCERSFSDAGRIMTDDGNRLSAEHLKQRVFLYKLSDNIWYHKK
ncbi:Zinc finger BED domain-containing protein 4 [Frankliniella fusca]|uniref:Zinc finger BED domain-containing protein 4 n=1 Tax=Frankliniella fusca TaxID=407009 RepID=A0AAE1LTZ4_9NEOP|nr:Zinc finger BED domain-containing protein 4 [Frankliniella fusca]